MIDTTLHNNILEQICGLIRCNDWRKWTGKKKMYYGTVSPAAFCPNCYHRMDNITQFLLWTCTALRASYLNEQLNKHLCVVMLIIWKKFQLICDEHWLLVLGKKSWLLVGIFKSNKQVNAPELRLWSDAPNSLSPLRNFSFAIPWLPKRCLDFALASSPLIVVLLLFYAQSSLNTSSFNEASEKANFGRDFCVQ